MIIRTTLLASVCALAAACSGNSPSSNQRALSGRIDTAKLRLVNAQAIAQAADGRVFRAPVSSAGDFRLVLPVGVKYTIRFANSTTNATRFDSFAVLSVGAGKHAFNWTAGSELAVGRVGSGAAGLGLGTASEHEGSAESGDDSSSGGDDQCIEDDEVEACDLSNGADEIEVECEHDILASVDTDDDGISDRDDDHDDRNSCSTTSAADDDCSMGDEMEQEHDDEMEHEHNAPCMTGSTPPAGGGSTTPTPVSGVVVP